MSTNTFGINFAAIQKNKSGNRKWGEALKAKILTLADKHGVKDVAAKLKIHENMIYMWRSAAKRNGKGAAKPSKRSAKLQHDAPNGTSAYDRGGLIEGLRRERTKLASFLQQIDGTIAGLENGGAIPDTVSIMDAMVPIQKRRGGAKTLKNGRRLSAKGSAAIAKAARKRWATYRANKNKTK